MPLSLFGAWDRRSAEEGGGVGVESWALLGVHLFAFFLSSLSFLFVNSLGI